MMINEKVFSGLSVMAVANLLQIPQVRRKLFFLNIMIRVV